MIKSAFKPSLLAAALALLVFSTVGIKSSLAQSTTPTSPDQAKIHSLSQQQVEPLLNSLKEMVSIESGSRDLEGLAKMQGYVTDRLKAAGMQTEVIPLKAPEFHPLLKGAAVGSAVIGRIKGTGKKSVLLIAHMDTVYQKGMAAKQPFKVVKDPSGDRAYGLGISDDKGGVALILHTVEMLRELKFSDYSELAVMINGDEEIGSPGSGPLITKLGGQYDAVFSFEGGGFSNDMVRLATSSIAIVELKVTGKASHAGAAPEQGRNALYEMAHQIMKSRNFGDDKRGLKINWTIANSGSVRNAIPAEATAIADIRALANVDLDEIENKLKESIKEKLIPDTKVEMSFLRSRPAFVANDASRAMAKHALGVFGEIGRKLEIRDRATGGGTDAAFAGLAPKGGVLESFGLRGFGAHSNDDEYVIIDSIAPRLYLSTRMVMDMGRGLIAW
jgi:glutamate carboxypeptidase